MTESKPQPDHWHNLLWAVGSEDISRDSSLPWLPAQRRAELVGYFRRAEVRERLAPSLDSNTGSGPAQALRQNDQQQNTGRLGVYFENLWEFAFRHHPDYELLHRNLPLRADGRTLGELDFVVHHLPSGATEHWEVAVKFYLQVDAKHWVGPGLRDRLDIKLARMRDHQLPFVHRNTASEILLRHGIRIDCQWARMPGRLFRPLGGHESLPVDDTVNAGSAGYWWATGEAFRRAFGRQPLRWVILPKRTWLAERGYRAQGSESADELANRLQLENRQSPVCVAAREGGRETERGFIVPGQWHSAALERLR